ncbi:3-deoxy-D-manno-octulosonic acid transferase [Phaeobacter marinintestinus]|uniref:3-deoxy-D-manno-octulosonic acid transferase n=1 Tax=Falsiphaeobacter marinintestinus TaxID=1492905 RepID=UPI0011B72B08|nr:3-deoxy-D-manno-octulosonic acid transferase [Phaeobacter marinintestinus]
MSAPSSAPTPLFRIYRAATTMLVPFAWRKVSRRLAAAGVPPERMQERLGNASLPRPPGQLIWFHAASVGESLSVLSLIKRLGDRVPGAQFLITSGTPTSAALVAQRMPPRTRHQYAPLDASGPVARFYAHWRPAAGLFVESELWPLMLVKGREAGTRLALLNARLSRKSVDGWKKRPDTARFILSQFDLLIAQNQTIADDLIAMGADPARVHAGSNLKASSAAPPVQSDVLEELRGRLGDRPVWTGSSTHAGEEEIVLEAHRQLLTAHPDLCLILVPRHPERGDEVEALLHASGLTYARRTSETPVTPETQVYLADTLGETGTWYALSPIAFLGATLVPKGGHNPFEPALAGVAVVAGPHVDNAADAYAGLDAAGGMTQIETARDLAAQVGHWLNNPADLETTRTAAQSYAETQNRALDDVVNRLCAALDLDHG